MTAAHEAGRQAAKEWVMSREGDPGRFQLARLAGWVESRRRRGLAPWTDPAAMALIVLGAGSRPGQLWADHPAGGDPDFVKGWVLHAYELWSQLQDYCKRKLAEQERGRGPQTK